MIGTTSSQMLWYTTRATGIVALVLLTATMVMGVLTTVRFGTWRWPRFTWQDIHRRISLLALVFVGLHVVTTVSDSFAPIGWISVVVPFTSSYRRLWLGLGTVSVDLLLAVTISSLVRSKINPRTWRALHWLAYASWPLAVVHALGTGTDPHLGWMLLLTIGCVASVLGALGWRLAAGWPARAGTRVVAGIVSTVAVVALAAWTAAGPLRPGWAARAGTPAALLGSHRSAVPPPTASSGAQSPPTSSSVPGSGALPAPPYRAALAGTFSQQAQSGGIVQVAIRAQTAGTLVATLDVVITGTPDGSGGVIMQRSRATFGPPSTPGEFQGQITALDGSRLVLALTSGAGATLGLRVDLSVAGSHVTGELTSLRGAGGASGLGADDGN